jgi:folate-binding protein YgfZ
MSEPSPPTSSWLAFLASRGARAAAGRVADFGEPEAELLAARDGTIVADLSHNALIEVTGDDATAFLHAQFTNDVAALPEGAAQWNGWCSAKGRLLATFLLLKRRDGYLLMLPAEIAPAVAKRLAMFVLRSKVKIRDASGEMARIGFAGKTASVRVARHWEHTPDPMRSVGKDGIVCVALDILDAMDAQRFVIFSPFESAPKIWDTLAENATKAGSDAWEWTSIHAGIPTIVAATQEAFVPQMANFDLVGGLSFKKGCYPGQEIVARTQYRGILKKRMALAHVGGGTRPAPGQSVYSRIFGDQAAGEIVNVAPAPGGAFDLLVVAQIESLRDGDLHLDSVQGPPLDIKRRFQPPDAV